MGDRQESRGLLDLPATDKAGRTASAQVTGSHRRNAASVRPGEADRSHAAVGATVPARRRGPTEPAPARRPGPVPERSRGQVPEAGGRSTGTSHGRLGTTDPAGQRHPRRIEYAGIGPTVVPPNPGTPAAPTTRSRLTPLKLEPTVNPTKIGNEVIVTVSDAKNGANIKATYAAAERTMTINRILVIEANQVRTLSDQRYAVAIRTAEQQMGTTVKTVVGTPVLSNEIGPGGAAATPRAQSLGKLGFTKHVYDKVMELIVSTRPD